MLQKPKDSQNPGQLEGPYANYVQVGHNAFEFVLDFGQFYPGSGPPWLHTRIITVPFYAKALCELLQESIAQYEQTFGAIPEEHEGE
jgi:hypothetical protein